MASRAKTMSPSATIQVTTIELVTGNGPRLNSGTASEGKPWCSGSARGAPAEDSWAALAAGAAASAALSDETVHEQRTSAKMLLSRRIKDSAKPSGDTTTLRLKAGYPPEARRQCRDVKSFTRNFFR